MRPLTFNPFQRQHCFSFVDLIAKTVPHVSPFTQVQVQASTLILTCPTLILTCPGSVFRGRFSSTSIVLLICCSNGAWQSLSNSPLKASSHPRCSCASPPCAYKLVVVVSIMNVHHVYLAWFAKADMPASQYRNSLQHHLP